MAKDAATIVIVFAIGVGVGAFLWNALQQKSSQLVVYDASNQMVEKVVEQPYPPR